MDINNILVIIRKSNGDVLLSNSLIYQLKKKLKPRTIDLLINDDTLAIAKRFLTFVKLFHSLIKREKKIDGSKKKILFKEFIENTI